MASQLAKTFAVAPAAPSTLAVLDSSLRFAVRRVYCVGRNYRAHAVEMEKTQKALNISAGDQVDDPPFFFQKPAFGAVVDCSAPGAVARYPPRTAQLEHELELIVALGGGGADIAVADAPAAVFGSALGVDLTRRDLQHAAKASRRPWDAAKGFDDSAPVGALVRGFVPAGDVALALSVNGAAPRQTCRVDQMIYGVAEVIAHLSREVELMPGDLIFTGTPAGVATLARGDVVDCAATGPDGAEVLPRCRFEVA